jgi:hypothetical protein
MTFGNDTMIETCHETDNMPRLTLNLTPLSELTNVSPGAFVGEFFFLLGKIFSIYRLLNS